MIFLNTPRRLSRMAGSKNYQSPNRGQGYAPPVMMLVLCFFLYTARCPAQGQQPSPTPYVPRTVEVTVPPPVVLPAPPEQPADVPNRPLTADEAARIALVHQPDITVARSGVLAAAGNTQVVRAPANPNAIFNSSYTSISPTSVTNAITSTSVSGTTPGGTTAGFTGSGVSTPGYQTNATVRQLLFDFNHTRDLVREALAQELAAGASLTQVESDTVLQVKTAFYAYVQNTRLVKVNEKNVTAQKEHVTMAEERYRAGVGLPSDVVRANAALSDAIFSLTQSRNDALQSMVSLSLAMGIDPRTPLEASDEPEPALSFDTLDALIAMAFEKRPEMIQALATLQASQYRKSAAFTNDAPALTGSAGWFTRGQEFFGNTIFTNLGVSVQWPLYDGGETAGLVKEAQASIMSALARIESTRQIVVSDVAKAYLNLQTAKQKLATAEAELANADEALKLTEGRYRAGLGTLLDVLDAESAYLGANTNCVNARSALDQSNAALSYAVGAALPSTFAQPGKKSR